MSLGRIHCILFATRGGDVIYERFYDRLSEIDKGEVRAAFALAASNVRLNVDGSDHDYVGAFRTAKFAFLPYADMVVYLLGSGEYELAGADIIRNLLSIMQDVLDKQPTASVLLEKYTKVCLIVDEVINEGILETVDREVVRKAIKNKAVWE